LTLAALEAISEMCISRNIDYRVMLIPTKERVYWEALPDARMSDHRTTIERLVADESAHTSAIKSWLEDRHIAFSDPLADLKEAARKGLPVYAQTENGHPSGEGYRVIAAVAARDLRSSR
jgi:lysophospholipase L1-like esterase